MKTIITALLISMSAFIYGQSDTVETPVDTSYMSAKMNELYFEVGLVQSQVDCINLKLSNHREEFKEGLNYQFVGALFFVTGMLVANNSQWGNSPDRAMGYAIMGIGGIMFTAGVVVVIDSDKWLK